MVRKLYFLPQLHPAWNRIVATNPAIKPTQRYDYHRWLWLMFYLRHPFSRWTICYHYVQHNSDECIVPLVVNRKRRKLHSLSFYGKLDYEDIISTTQDPAINSHFLQQVLSSYADYQFHSVNINADSRLCAALQQNLQPDDHSVAIHLPDNYDEWFNSLAKHQRQNIRTAYNKVQKEGFAISLHRYDSSCRIPRPLWHNLQLLYEERHFSQLSPTKLWWQRQLNAYTHMLRRLEGHRIYVLMHEGVPLAYLAGIFSPVHSTLYVPRLCINMTFYRYSPGILLLCETIKCLVDEHTSTLDLMWGDEPYKYAMGGTPSIQYFLNCQVNNLLCTLHSK